MIRRVFFILLLILPGLVSAHTWRVDQNGGGDFVVLQDALDAAASGDTISIGPGRYDDWATYGEGQGAADVRGFVDIGVLTVIGSGSATVIGPDIPWDQSQGQTHGFEVSDVCSVLRVQHVVIENLERGIMMGYGDSLFVADCEFRDIRVSVATGSRFASIERSEIQGILAGGFGVISYFQDRLFLADCLSTTDVIALNDHLQVEGPAEVSVTGCRFVGAGGGIVLSRGPSADIRRSEFVDQANYGIVLATLAPSCMLTDCVFRDQGRALVGSAFPGSEWLVDRVVFESVSHSTLNASYLQAGYIHNSQLGAGEHGVVSNRQYNATMEKEDQEEPTNFDMRGNWWGTTDPDSISALIFDYNDEDDVHYIIDFDPFLSRPVEVEKRSLGEIKTLFRTH